MTLSPAQGYAPKKGLEEHRDHRGTFSFSSQPFITSSNTLSRKSITMSSPRQKHDTRAPSLNLDLTRKYPPTTSPSEHGKKQAGVVIRTPSHSHVYDNDTSTATNGFRKSSSTKPVPALASVPAQSLADIAFVPKLNSKKPRQPFDTPTTSTVAPFHVKVLPETEEEFDQLDFRAQGRLGDTTKIKRLYKENHGFISSQSTVSSSQEETTIISKRTQDRPKNQIPPHRQKERFVQDGEKHPSSHRTLTRRDSDKGEHSQTDAPREWPEKSYKDHGQERKHRSRHHSPQGSDSDSDTVIKRNGNLSRERCRPTKPPKHDQVRSNRTKEKSAQRSHDTRDSDSGLSDDDLFKKEPKGLAVELPLVDSRETRPWVNMGSDSDLDDDLFKEMPTGRTRRKEHKNLDTLSLSNSSSSPSSAPVATLSKRSPDEIESRGRKNHYDSKGRDAKDQSRNPLSPHQEIRDREKKQEEPRTRKPSSNCMLAHTFHADIFGPGSPSHQKLLESVGTPSPVCKSDTKNHKGSGGSGGSPVNSSKSSPEGRLRQEAKSKPSVHRESSFDNLIKPLGQSKARMGKDSAMDRSTHGRGSAKESPISGKSRRVSIPKRNTDRLLLSKYKGDVSDESKSDSDRGERKAWSGKRKHSPLSDSDLEDALPPCMQPKPSAASTGATFRLPSPTRKRPRRLMSDFDMLTDADIPEMAMDAKSLCPYCGDVLPVTPSKRLAAALAKARESIKGPDQASPAGHRLPEGSVGKILARNGMASPMDLGKGPPRPRRWERPRTLSPSRISRSDSAEEGDDDDEGSRDRNGVSVMDKFELCRIHIAEEKIVPRGQEKGYPMRIKFDLLSSRVTEMKSELMGIIQGTVPSVFLDRALEKYERMGTLGARHPHVVLAGVQQTLPGYYGSKGSAELFKILVRLFVDTSLLNHESALPQKPVEYIQQVLIPEVGLRLIVQDWSRLWERELRQKQKQQRLEQELEVREGLEHVPVSPFSLYQPISLVEAEAIMMDSVEFGCYVHDLD